MKIKTKLSLGVGLLLLLIVTVTFVSGKYIRDLRNDTENILRANYKTLDYARNMMIALDEPDLEHFSSRDFEENLARQAGNITEPGEAEATRQLVAHFQALKESLSSDSLRRLVRRDLSDIMGLNMRAIVAKSDQARATAETATSAIAFTGTICLLIALVLLVNLPGNIANPIRELTGSIQQIAAKNYDERVHFESHGEFGDLARSFNTMAEKLQEFDSSSLADLLYAKKRSEALIEHMEEPVIGLDENQVILFANRNALQVLGMAKEQVVGRSSKDIAKVNDLMRALTDDLSAETRSEPKEAPAPLKIFKDNRESYFEKEIVGIQVVPTGERKEQSRGHVILLKNVTLFKELDYAKTHFLATISHELKTPISSIKLSLQLLQNPVTGTINDEQAQLLESVRDDSDRLLRITGELLNMTQIETGKIELFIEPTDPIRILDYALETIRVPAEQKRMSLVTRLGESLPRIQADHDKTTWVLTNLLTNAIRHSPEQSRVEISLEQKENQLFFYVKDQGKGIEERYLSRIFDRYFQVPGHLKEGTGLGLAICKEFIEAQRGQIGVESTVGMGSTFYFWLPVGR
ncbi:HAMP domain-containing sensor histidine kinase [Salmonirosea aquatica]|uniref:histidine kinase n=1 Tax=Salmonirosea aquatica TaxID=2654236 RepID=A0A7C9FSI3_9BACT|nr:HAMP domain-containing protein [Cytophagaceae bacterium SJW1-29]